MVVDAKVPLDAYLDATVAPTTTDARDAATCARHARQLRTHVDALSAKPYWRSLPETPEFVVLFVPGGVVPGRRARDRPRPARVRRRRAGSCSPRPTTLIALLRTVAHGWSHEALAEQAREIHRLGRELHDRLATMSGHLDQVGRSLNGAVGHYNQAVGSLETRVLVSARRFTELAVTDDELPAPRPVTHRRSTAPTSVRPSRRGGPAGARSRAAPRPGRTRRLVTVRARRTR